MKTKLESGSRANLFHYPRNSDISFLLLRSGKVVKGCASGLKLGTEITQPDTNIFDGLFTHSLTLLKPL